MGQPTDLSDRMGRMRAAFEAVQDTGLTMQPRSVGVVVEAFKALEQEARALENELMRHRWNQAARRERLEDGLASGKVKIFPIVARRPPHPDGGAA